MATSFSPDAEETADADHGKFDMAALVEDEVRDLADLLAVLPTTGVPMKSVPRTSDWFCSGMKLIGLVCAASGLTAIIKAVTAVSVVFMLKTPMFAVPGMDTR